MATTSTETVTAVPARAAASVDAAESVPRNVRTARVGARVGYVVTTAVFVYFVCSTPGSSLWRDDGEMDGGVGFALIFWLAAAAVSYFAVQGSNPGYVGDDALNSAEAEARGLLKGSGAGDRGLSAAMVDDSDDEEGAGMVATSGPRERRSATPAAAAGSSAAPAPAAPAPAAEAQGGGSPARPRRDAFGAALGGGEVQSARSDLAELGLTEDELEAAVDAELERRLGNGAGWLEDEELERLGPAPPPRAGVPVRAHFCHVSRRYVHTFDHYCGFLATPVGERNHCRFWWFLLAQTAALGTALGIVHEAFAYAPTVAAWWDANGGTFALATCLWCLFAFVGSMLLLHSWLAVTGSTSYELLKGPGRVWYLRHTRLCDYPFSTGIVANLRRFCCTSDALCTGIYGRRWRGKAWRVPGAVVRDSDDVLEHCWENRFWSCC